MQANALHRKPRIMLRHLLFAGLTCNLETDAFAMLRAIGRLDVTILKIQICMVQVGSWNLLAETPTALRKFQLKASHFGAATYQNMGSGCLHFNFSPLKL